MQSEIRWPSVAVVAVVIAGIVAMVWLQVSAETIGAISIACVAIIGAMHRVYAPGDNSIPPAIVDAPKPHRSPVRPPPLPPTLSAIMLVVGLLSAGCAEFTRQEVASITADAAACVLANIDLPNEQIAAKCGIAIADRIVLDALIAEARAQVAKAKAAQAADFDKKLATCSSAPAPAVTR